MESMKHIEDSKKIRLSLAPLGNTSFNEMPTVGTTQQFTDLLS
jgi:hypothetical protein